MKQVLAGLGVVMVVWACMYLFTIQVFKEDGSDREKEVVSTGLHRDGIQN